MLPLLLSKDEPRLPRRAVGPTAFNVRGTRNIRLLTVWGGLLVSGQYAVLTFLGLDLHQRMGLGLAEASAFVAIAQAGGIAGRIGWGALSDRLLPAAANRSCSRSQPAASPPSASSTRYRRRLRPE